MSGATMRVTGAGCVIIGPEGRTPPLPFVTVPESEGESFIALKLANRYTGEEPEAEAPAEETPADETPNAPEGGEGDDANTGEGGNANEGEGDDANAGEDEGGNADADRAAIITEALDLMEEGDLVKNGERAGRPKLAAMEAATGIADLTVDEIDAAIAAKDSAD